MSYETVSLEDIRKSHEMYIQSLPLDDIRIYQCPYCSKRLECSFSAKYSGSVICVGCGEVHQKIVTRSGKIEARKWGSNE